MNINESIHFFKQSLLSDFTQRETDALLPYMAEYVFSTSYFKITLIREKNVTEKQYNRLNKLLVELKAGKPVQYIVGHTCFFDHRIGVNEHVLIPRPETEEVVDALIKIMQYSNAGASVLDIGTGSGCIPIAIKHVYPQARVEAMDISENALKVARQNAKRNNVDIHFFYEDILQPGNDFLQKQYDFIISNPPYIPSSELDKMSRQVVDFEPREALFVPDASPLLFYEQLALVGKRILNEKGVMVVEINEFHAQSVMDIFARYNYGDIRLEHDLQDKSRMIIMKKNG